MEGSQICKFYQNQNVFITGGTGFLGKILLEKLLRSTDVSTVYLLIREKKGKNTYSRLDEIFDSIIFEKLKTERPKFRHRVIPMSGDCSITGLGLTINDRQKLISEVNVVFHVAATVRFDENLKLAYAINVSGTSDVIELCRQIRGLKSVIHVSTAYSNCFLNSIEEKLYDYPVKPDQIGSLLEKMTKNEAAQLTPKLIGNWPNTYTFTKALAESLIQDTANNLPVGIFRPSIVTSTYREPIHGWTDNLYGPSGVVAGAATGLLRVFPCKSQAVADVVPVDTCVSGMIAAAWDVANKTTDLPIYNYVSSVENAITWEEFLILNKHHGLQFPLAKAVYTIMLYYIENKNLYLFLRLLFHTIPAFFLDILCILTGQKPKLTSMYVKIHKFSNAVSYFTTREWKFTNKNVTALWEKMNKSDQTIFPLSMKTVSWTAYFQNYFKGLRVYVLNEPLSTVDEGIKRKNKFDILHNLLKFLGAFVVVTLMWLVFFKFTGLLGAESASTQRENFDHILRI